MPPWLYWWVIGMALGYLFCVTFPQRSCRPTPEQEERCRQGRDLMPIRIGYLVLAWSPLVAWIVVTSFGLTY